MCTREVIAVCWGSQCEVHGSRGLLLHTHKDILSAAKYMGW